MRGNPLPPIRHPPFQIVAHRGASGEAPENTLPAFQLAWDEGADAIEGDFHLTADQRVVCIHDEDTGRVSDKSLPIERTDFATLRGLDCGSWKSEAFAGARIPSLTEFLDLVPPGKSALLELKTGSKIVEPLLAELDQRPVDLSQLTFMSFQANALAELKGRRPQIEVRWLHEFCQPPDREALPFVIDTVRSCGASGVGLSALPLPSRSFAQGLRKAGIDLHVWTVDDPDLARRWIALGAASLTTNHPSRLRQQLSR
ncbi:glycerophosphodiester phosphodiesterase [Pelagicoccus sp. SDUM812003]|uniref:glycerophosphodiester phosphodiesterase n=1 Tax=Pelagicoccus sp. SDUM812003 TaxID=3041267 RepID=UPI00280DDE99|nr:glycerophosphodiester phosphodiesterase [Pelagicoccus sp. SDUM812003]MDQ8202713.1 glycerophosphodiester phosphodiesterase [Pelagicoccus sp. SDUM812003]